MSGLFLAVVAALGAIPFVFDPFPVGAVNVRLALAFTHTASFAAFFGTTVWMSFIGGLIMFYSLPRHAFGKTQARLFPAYFQWSAVEIAVAIASLHLLQLPGGGGKEHDGLTAVTSPISDAALAVWSLRAALVLSLVNLFLLEPVTTATMFKRHVVENKLNPDVGREVPKTIKPTDPAVTKDAEWMRLTRRFGALHGVSTLVNLATFGAGLVHVFILANRVAPALAAL